MTEQPIRSKVSQLTQLLTMTSTHKFLLQWGVRLCYAAPPADAEKMYDAYIAYSIKDEHFVGGVLAPELEHGDGPAHRLCLHYRDFPANAYVADSIVEAVASRDGNF